MSDYYAMNDMPMAPPSGAPMAPPSGAPMAPPSGAPMAPPSGAPLTPPLDPPPEATLTLPKDPPPGTPSTFTGTISTEIEAPSLPPMKLIKTKQGYGWIVGGDYSRVWTGTTFENM